MNRFLMFAFAAFAVFTLMACPGETDTRTVVDECTKTGTQCRMGAGKLGVCMMNADGTFECASQH